MKLAIIALLGITCAELFAADSTGFIFKENGRRDPFSYSFRPEIRQPAREKLPEIDIAGNLTTAGQHLNQAERALMELRIGDCIEKCETALGLLKDAPTDRAEIESLRQALSRIRKAGETMRERDEAVAAFGKLKLTVSGVVSRPRKAQAIVNGAIVREGQTISAEGNETLLVERISSDQVVLNFRGFRMAAQINAAD